MSARGWYGLVNGRAADHDAAGAFASANLGIFPDSAWRT